MSDIFARVIALREANDIRISEHGYDELVDDGITVEDVLAGIESGVVIKEYPDFPKGPCVLVLQFDHAAHPVHVVWGMPKGTLRPAVLVTAYRPDPNLWNETFTQRRQ